jgi:hypothetical protein
MNNVSFAQAIKHFFGQLPGQTLTDFVAEMKQLTDADRDEFKAGLIAVGYTFK